MFSYRSLLPLVLLALFAAPLCSKENPDPPNLEEAEKISFERFGKKAKETLKTPEDFNAFKTELMAWYNRPLDIRRIHWTGFAMAKQCNYPLQQFGDELKTFVQSDACKLSAEQKTEELARIDSEVWTSLFDEYLKKSQKTVNTPESFSLFKAEVKTWFNKHHDIPFYYLEDVLSIAEKNGVPAYQCADEMIAFVQSSDCTLPKKEKERAVKAMKAITRLLPGSDLELYGKTIDGEDFHWANLRGKYVLAAFLTMRNERCEQAIPDLLEAYKKYHDKGLEIIAVHIWDDERSVERIRGAVADELIPWTVLSEYLAVEAPVPEDSIVYEILSQFLTPAFPAYYDFYEITGIPTMVITDKEGKVMMSEAWEKSWRRKLAEIFE